MTPTVLITGASQGIGKSTALLFARRGYNTVIASRTASELNAVAKEIESLGGEVLAIPTDTRDRAAVETLVAKGIERFGQIDVLINNAGICMSASMAQTSIEDWEKIINTNLWGYIYAIKAVLPQMLERKQGSIINVGSFGGKVPMPNMTAYCTSKHAIVGLTETMRIELEPQGIHVSGVHPSVTKTDFLERAVFRDKDPQKEKQRRQDMEKFIESPLASESEDVAKAIWKAVKHSHGSIVVGSAKFPAFFHRLFPSMSKTILQVATNL
ncbi:SDR family oxidoreductase [Myxosarcina sp. GI1]|uniref:SDR family NAD(P)-dependent oxidoreductase n=1 Tax=Myxosarcina sp. GI1 TaxID=1541065 RepID=UPI000561FA18|nr:SDR family oxidoreductase [Myxosarcina sp. GI1]